MTRPTSAAEIFTQLKAPFHTKDIEWKLGGTNKDQTKGRALPYLKFQAVADRLDAVLGETNWTNTYVSGPAGGVVCRLSIRIENDWLTKENGAANTDREGVKGGLSDAFKRAATMFGVGRYLHSYSAIMVDLEEGRWTAPALPDEFLPADEVEQRRQEYEAYEAEVAAGRLKADSAPATDALASTDAASAMTPATPEAEVKAESAKAARARSTTKATTEPVQPPAPEAGESASKEAAADVRTAVAEPAAETTAPVAAETSSVTVVELPVEQLAEATAVAPAVVTESEPAPEAASAPAPAAEPAAFTLDENGYPLVPEGLPEADIKLLGSLVARVAKAEQLDPVRDYLENGKGRTALTELARKFLFAYVAREEAIRKEKAAAAA